MAESVPAIAGTYDCGLVALSILIAICASYTALGLGSRTAAATGSIRLVWLTCGAISMGFGIWSMHYVGMLAFALPIPILYDLPTVTVSLLAAIVASAVALFVVSRPVVTSVDAGFGSIFMASAILAMHYIGMAAMRVRAICHYDSALLAASGVIAMGGSLAALWSTFYLRAPKRGIRSLKVVSAIAMGIAISAMHYIGMAAASFYRSNQPVDYSRAVSVSALGLTGIVIVTFLLLGFAVFSSAIDQRLAAHRALAEELYRSRQMLQSILDNIPERVFWKDGSGRYLGCNQAFANDAGLPSPEHIIGKKSEELPSLGESPAYSKDLEAVMQTGAPILNAVLQTITPEDHERWLRASAVCLRDSQQQIFGVLGTYEDVTERKRAEDALKRSNAALAEFAHVVSHDLQSPVRVAKVYTQIVTKKYGDQLDEQGREFLKQIEATLVHMHDLIQSLLTYATATEPDPGGDTQVSLDVALQQAIANLQLLIKETQTEITQDALPSIIGYPTQLVQLFQNLISNAIKYRKPDSKPRVHVGATNKPKEWIICIRDNGIGIAPEDQERIFNPLKRLHGRNIPGFGIGLATCRKVVEHHDGRMWVESQVGIGSTFYFSLRKSGTGNPPADHQQRFEVTNAASGG